MAFSEIGPREVCVTLMIICAVVLAARLRPRVARAVWLGLLAAGIANALVLNLQSYNLIHSNLVHYFLGAKYPFPYQSFYRLINAAQEKPQIGMRDLGQPDRWVRDGLGEQRAYYIDLMREDGVEFDPLASLAELSDRARREGVLQREAQRILSEKLPAGRIEGFRRDVTLATSARIGRDLTHDAGFNGSPFYALVRHADPTLYRPIGRETAWLNLAWQAVAVLVLAWIMGSAIGVGVNGRLGMAALVFASWDFVSFAFPGLIFAGLFLPVAIALYAIRRRAAAQAGVAIAWVGLIKLFPVILLLPAAARLVRAGLRRVRKDALESLPRRSLVLFVAMGWVVHNWLNYYSVAVLLLLPLLARRHRVVAPAAVLAMALAFVLPEFSDPRLVTSPVLLRLKLAPYILVPAWLVFLEFRAMGLSRRVRRIAVAACILGLVATAGEAWRMHTVREFGNTAHACLNRGDANSAIEHYQRLLKHSPRNAAAYNGRAVASVIRGDLANARNDFERAVRLSPNDGGVRQNYGRLLLKNGKVDAAAREFELARRLVPYDESILLDLARARLSQGQNAEAESLLTRALELQPTNAAINRLLRAAQRRSP